MNKGFLVAAAWLPSLWLAAAAEGGRPNLVVILADDMGTGDIGAFRELYPGGPEDPRFSSRRDPRYPGSLPIQLAHRHTPHLDRLAKEGIRCTRAYSAAWCAPSRQMLLSGQWSSRANAYDHPWVGAQLRGAGYATGMVGKSHGARPTDKVFRNLDPDTAEFDDGLFFNAGARGFYFEAGETLPGRTGFDPFTFTAAGGEYVTDVFTDHAVAFIERHAPSAGSGQAKPFMLYLAYTAPHEPLHGKPEDMRKLFPDVFGGMTNEEIRAPVAGQRFRGVSDEMKAYHYAAMVYAMDRGIGRVVRTLEERGIADNTLVVFTCDNGAQWGCNYPGSGHKTETRDGGIRVPFIAWSAEIARSGRGGSVYNGLVSLADIAPTLMAQASGKPYPHPTDGMDIMPYLTGRKTPPSGRTWFWSNASRGESLRTKIDGAHDFWDRPLPEVMIQSVYVKDEEKVTCWHALGTGRVGAVYNRLPDVAGRASPAEHVVEHPPVAGQVPAEGDGRALFGEMAELLRSSGNALLPTWSGAPERELERVSTWWFEP